MSTTVFGGRASGGRGDGFRRRLANRPRESAWPRSLAKSWIKQKKPDSTAQFSALHEGRHEGGQKKGAQNRRAFPCNFPSFNVKLLFFVVKLS
ncbi:MAG: hypothetical protein LBU12_07730 [Deltaproteobacteria bacterium]|nr:hypothetical protein [Deltaproteobacteria bacterium]